METVKVRVKKNPTAYFVVKSEFLKSCPNPEEQEEIELLEKYQIQNFLHNTEGPALVNEEAKLDVYFLNANFIGCFNHTTNRWDYAGNSEEEIKKSKDTVDGIIYGSKFKEGFDKALNE